MVKLENRSKKGAAASLDKTYWRQIENALTRSEFMPKVEELGILAIVL